MEEQPPSNLEGQLEMLSAMNELAHERSKQLGIPFDQVEMSDVDILQKMFDRRMILAGVAKAVEDLR